MRCLEILASLANALVVPLAGQQANPDSARALFETRLRAVSAPGAQLVVLVGGRTALAVNYGTADSAGVVPVSDTTRFRAGSISKLITATAAALLWERGALDLDAPVERLVPEFPAHQPPVTVRFLAGHLAGVRHYIGRDFVTPPRRWDDVIDALALFAADTLVAPPGTRYFYSSFGYNLLGAAVQRAAGEEFRTHVARAVFAPFGMRRSLYERSDSAIGGLSLGFDPAPSGGGVRPAARSDLSDRWPSGGLLSTASDLARFAEASVRGGQLSERVRQLLFAPMRRGDGTETGVGLGWRVGTDAAGRTIYHHGGAVAGGRAMLMVWRDVPLVVAVMVNRSPGAGQFSEADAMAIGRLMLP